MPGSRPARTGQRGGHTFIERQLEILPDQIFRQQILNQRTEALAGWVTRGQWAACRDPIGFLAGPDAPKLIAACEFSEDGSLYALVITQQVAGRIVTRVMAEKTADGLWARVCELPQNALLLVSAGFKGRIPLAPCATRLVGVNEVRLATRPTLRAIQDQTIAHDGDPTLASHILTAVIAQAGEAGPVVSQRRSPGPITMARALCWCVGATLEIDAKPAPRVYSAQRMTDPRPRYALPPPSGPPPGSDQLDLWEGSCPRCEGAGRMPIIWDADGQVVDEIACETCGGSGIRPAEFDWEE